MKPQTTLGVVLVLGFLTSACVPTSAKRDAALQCYAAKPEATGEIARDLLRCQAAAAEGGAPLDPVCIRRVRERFLRQFSEAEARRSCATSGDAAAIAEGVDRFVTAVGVALAPSGSESDTCAAAKLKATGTVTYDLLRCYSRGVLTGMAVARDCVVMADANFSAAFEAAERRANCRTVDDVTGLAVRVDAFVVHAILALDLCDDNGRLC